MYNKKSILKLYHSLKNEIHELTPSNLQILNQIVEQENLLNVTLTKEQKEILDKIRVLQYENNELLFQQVFVYSFSLATNLFIEGLTKEENK